MPLRVGLAHTQIKLSRAHEHLEELKGTIAEYRKNGYTVVRKDDPWKGVHVMTIRAAIMPDKLGALPGEFAYCLRSGLDHLAWQLALLTTDAPGKETCFPIYGTPPDPSPKSRYSKSVANFPASATAVINGLQPHNRGAAFKDDLLWQLNELCNIDKHQAIAVGCMLLEFSVTGVSQLWRKDTANAFQVAVPLSEKESVQLNVNVPGVVFGEPIDALNGAANLEIGVDRFEEIYKFVRYDVVPGFAKFFV